MNETEGKLLNSIFETTRNDFDFINKKVGFIKDGKRRYFDMQKKHSADTSYPLDNGKLYIFNAQQKAKSGGYDAAIVYWSKFLFTAEQVVEKLKYQN
ncbi:MAG TPA: hypothetical protein VEC36_12880 [Patescibacteria group bacterium]|nr:hypothetical protein [Patescibacteria group bacterium]